MKAVYYPIGVPTYDMEAAQKIFDASSSLLRNIGYHVQYPDNTILSLSALEKQITKNGNADLVIIQNITFANSAYTAKIVTAHREANFLLWTLEEPEEGKNRRLRLNSLTGSFSAANTLINFNKPFAYVYGSPYIEDTRKNIESVFRASMVLYLLRHAKMAQIGHTPEGFGFGRALDNELLDRFGVFMTSIEARELIGKAKNVNDIEIENAERDFSSICPSCIIDENKRDFYALFAAYRNFIRDQDISIVASRCWPDFFTEYGTPVCAVLSLLNSLGISASCECDVYGALSMFICSKLTGRSTFFGDPVSINEDENSITFWHCGMAAPDLCKRPAIGKHPNRKIGPVFDFATDVEGHVTIFRIGRLHNADFRFYIAKGESLVKGHGYQGTSITVKMETDIRSLIASSVEDGWEPHFVVAFGDISKELEILGKYLKIGIFHY